MRDFDEMLLEFIKKYEYLNNTDKHFNKLITGNTIYVFSGNLAGRFTTDIQYATGWYYGAIRRVGSGLTGRTYVIPIYDERLELLTLEQISKYVDQLYNFAAENEHLRFTVDKIGYHHPEFYNISMLFDRYSENVLLHPYTRFIIHCKKYGVPEEYRDLVTASEITDEDTREYQKRRREIIADMKRNQFEGSVEEFVFEQGKKEIAKKLTGIPNF